MAGALAIFAGRDDLPKRIAEAQAAAGRPYLVISFPADTRPWMAAHPHQVHAYEKVGRVFRALRAAGVRDVIFAGATNRPRLRPWRADWAALRVAARVLRLLRRGDDALLRGLAQIFEAEGFRVQPPEAFLPDLGVSAGVLTAGLPTAADRADAVRAAGILTALGPHDVGQAAVVAHGLCLGLEAIEGTDALLSRVAALPPEKRGAPGGVLLKLPKAGQDRRLDLPAIGPQTVAGAAAARLSGIVVEAGAALVLERDETVAAAEAAGLFLWAARSAELAAEAGR